MNKTSQIISICILHLYLSEGQFKIVQASKMYLKSIENMIFFYYRLDMVNN